MMLTENSVIEGRYKVISELGIGEFGSVIKVFDVEDGIKKALKIMPQEEKAFDRELKFLTAATHIEGITQLFSSFEFEDWSCLVLSLEGEPLDLVMSRSEDHGVSVKNLRRIMYSLGQTLMEIHSLGFVHRDLHARNILVTQAQSKCKLKIIDFGVCVKKKEKNVYGPRSNLDEDDNAVSFTSARHSSIRVINGGEYEPQDDWISLVYVLIHYNGVRFSDDGMQMIFDKYGFDDKPHTLLRPDLHWIADCYQLLTNDFVDFETILTTISGDEPDFDVKSPIEFEETDGRLKFE